MTSIATATKNKMLDAETLNSVSLHTAFPGVTGANEVSGGAPAYARKAIVTNAASGGQRLLNAAVTFDVPASTIRWVGFWNGATWIGAAPNGGAAPKNFVAVPATDTIYSTTHGYADTQKVVFFQGTPPAGLTEGTVYYVRDSTADSFKVAATSGGVAIDLTAGASFGCQMCAIVEDVYATQGSHTLSSATVAIPD